MAGPASTAAVPRRSQPLTPTALASTSTQHPRGLYHPRRGEGAPLLGALPSVVGERGIPHGGSNIIRRGWGVYWNVPHFARRVVSLMMEVVLQSMQ